MTVQTFAFVDLAGYTALTDAHGDQVAADLIERFESITQAVLRPAVEMVKSIGDAVLLASPDPQASLLSVEAVLQACAREPAFPLARAGMHTGTALVRRGDWFGSAVNIAARVCALAGGEHLLLTDTVAATVDLSQRNVHELGPTKLRGLIAPVPLYVIDYRSDAKLVVTDPVCRMRLDRRDAAGRLSHRAVESFFCSLSCAALFATNPDAYIDAYTSTDTDTGATSDAAADAPVDARPSGTDASPMELRSGSARNESTPAAETSHDTTAARPTTGDDDQC